MALPFKSDLDLENHQLKNAIIQNLATAPANPAEGQIYYDTTLKCSMFFNGTEWVPGTLVQIVRW